jgi:hypothetical protein
MTLTLSLRVESTLALLLVIAMFVSPFVSIIFVGTLVGNCVVICQDLRRKVIVCANARKTDHWDIYKVMGTGYKLAETAPLILFETRSTGEWAGASESWEGLGVGTHWQPGRVHSLHWYQRVLSVQLAQHFSRVYVNRSQPTRPYP